MNSYRPISVISVIAKVFERIVYDQLYSFLANEEIITSQQSGFCSLHSTVIALLEATDSWAFNIDRGNVDAVVFLDLKKDLIAQREIQVALMVFEALNDLVPDYLPSMFTERSTLS